MRLQSGVDHRISIIRQIFALCNIFCYICVRAIAKGKKRRVRVTCGNQKDCIADIDFHMDL
jgi:hypothetical protein